MCTYSPTQAELFDAGDGLTGEPAAIPSVPNSQYVHQCLCYVPACGCCPILPVPQMVERLIEAGANVQLVDVRGYTALQCAAEGGHMGPFRNLLQGGCDPMAQDHAGVSVLHSACQGGCLEIINHLQSLGADPSDRTIQGRDCLHYAALGLSSIPLSAWSVCSVRQSHAFIWLLCQWDRQEQDSSLR